ncbi:MAG: histidine phosphatase family protein [Clostridia bacterium]
MKKYIYLIRHSAPFLEINNYSDYKNVLWDDYNRNMILSIDGEINAQKMAQIKELKNYDELYASDSFRAIGTAKYLVEGNKQIKLDSRINERYLGIKTLNEIPEDFNKKSFDNKNYKLQNSESLNEVDERFKSFIQEILNKNSKKTIIVFHGIILLSYLETICDFKFDGKIVKANYKGKVIIDGILKNPDIFKITFENNEIIDIENIS